MAFPYETDAPTTRHKAAMAWDRAACAWKRAESFRRTAAEAEARAMMLTAEAHQAENKYLAEEALADAAPSCAKPE